MAYGKNIDRILYGGDYNPEQWPEEVWEEDIRLIKKAHINIVTLNTFSWAALQPSESSYCFEKLDTIMDFVRKNGLKVCMATSTGAHPAWMARKHPDILRTDFNGIKRKFGGRHNSCPNSPSYRKYAERLAGMLAKRYKDYENIVAWHISNEFGGECYCENCERAFRKWLKKRFGTVEEMNRVFHTSFWGHTFYDWDEVVLPNLQSEHFWLTAKTEPYFREFHWNTEDLCLKACGSVSGWNIGRLKKKCRMFQLRRILWDYINHWIIRSGRRTWILSHGTVIRNREILLQRQRYSMI